MDGIQSSHKNVSYSIMQEVTEFEIVDEYIKRSDVELIKAIWTSVCEYSIVKILFRYEICMF